MRLRRRFGRICRTCKLLPPPRPLPPTRTPPATRAWPCCRRSRPGAAAPHPHTSTGRNSRAPGPRRGNAATHEEHSARRRGAATPSTPGATQVHWHAARPIARARAPAGGCSAVVRPTLPTTTCALGCSPLLFTPAVPAVRQGQTITKSSAVKPRTITKEGDFKPNILKRLIFPPPAQFARL